MTRLREVRVVAIAVLVALLIAPATSIAGGPSHTGKSPRWRTLTDSDETTTSKCIGKPVTPICAVETFFGCFNRKQIELCRKAFRDGGSDIFDLGPPFPNFKTEYTIIKYQMIREVPAILRGGKYEKRPGDARVDIVSRWCRVTRNTCTGQLSTSFAYFTRHIGHQWLVYDYSAYEQPE